MSKDDNYRAGSPDKYERPTLDEYLKSNEFLKFAHDLDEAIKQYDLTHDIKFDDDGPRVAHDHRCGYDDDCPGLNDDERSAEQHHFDSYNESDYYAGRDDGPNRADPTDLNS